MFLLHVTSPDNCKSMLLGHLVAIYLAGIAIDGDAACLCIKTAVLYMHSVLSRLGMRTMLLLATVRTLVITLTDTAMI